MEEVLHGLELLVLRGESLRRDCIHTHMSYSLNSLKGIIGDYIRDYYRGY